MPPPGNKKSINPTKEVSPPNNDNDNNDDNNMTELITLLNTIPWKPIYTSLWSYFVIHSLYIILHESYKIRLYAIQAYGPIIHEFDPYFNYRATEYLYEHGWNKFVTWFDYMSWYPLGRPVGTTIYPGMQVTSVFIKRFLIGDNDDGDDGGMSLNDVCCYVPAWFGVIATIATGLIAYECSIGIVRDYRLGPMETEKVEKKGDDDKEGKFAQEFGSVLNHIFFVRDLYNLIILPIVYVLRSLLIMLIGTDFGFWDKPDKTNNNNSAPTISSPAVECGIFAAAIMAIVPAHTMRSVGGGYDNESVAMTAMTVTFYFWVRSLRCDSSWIFGIATGVAYFYMVASWGGYIFVLNLIGLHAAVLVGLGRYSTKLYRAYSLFYIVGTALATKVPVVGWAPFKSLEQLGPCFVFLGLQLFAFCDSIRWKRGLTREQAWRLRATVFGAAAAVTVVMVLLLLPTGYFGPISSRVRALFVKHTKTGNPLVDSVAEHQAASTQHYFQKLLSVCYIAPVGFLIVALFYFHDASSFLIVYALVAFFFSHKMSRLLLLTAPIASCLGGLALGRIFGWCLRSVVEYKPNFADIWNGSMWINPLGDESVPLDMDTEAESVAMVEKRDNVIRRKSRKKKKKAPAVDDRNLEDETAPVAQTCTGVYVSKVLRIIISIALIYSAYPYAKTFHKDSHYQAKALSNPTIVKWSNHRLIDDYREAYWWLRDNTPSDSRVMAWWDYGYQIAAIANRTTLADGNTWNHEHIALLGMILTSPEKEAHRIARHLADYVLVWAGKGSDDLAKHIHLARIGNSVYRYVCPDDPTCSSFGAQSRILMKPKTDASLIYKLHSNGLVPGVEVDPNRFKEVYTSKHGKVRIYKILGVSQESKEWVADPANRDCDIEGGWFCRGQYPPALHDVLEQKQDFAQLEDFNTGQVDESYQSEYFKNLNNPSKVEVLARDQAKNEPIQVTQKQIDDLQKDWRDTEVSTVLWELINKNNVQELKKIIDAKPIFAHVRSGDGRGPMWWAHEYGKQDIVDLLRSVGVSEKLVDRNGMPPVQQGKTVQRGKKEDKIGEQWEDTEITSMLWNLINQNNVQKFKQVATTTPELAFVRSGDGRGPMWWAHEYGRDEIIEILRGIGVSENLKDKYGATPLNLKSV